MTNNHLYKAFGFIIDSEYPIAQLPQAPEGVCADIAIRRADLSASRPQPNHCRINSRQITFCIEDVGTFRISDGELIEADPDAAITEAYLGVYLTGSCIGAVLHQRGYLPLHGSCVTDGERSVLITGDSGAGKSTLAAEFLSRGWKLLTDDVAPVYDVETLPMVRPSFPSQKLWEDSLNRYNHTRDQIHSLYSREDREKYGVNVSSAFQDRDAPLSMVVRLLPTPEPCTATDFDGVSALNQLMCNTYRSYMIAPEHVNRHFQRCATLAEKVPMVVLTRQEGVPCADILYNLILDRLNSL